MIYILIVLGIFFIFIIGTIIGIQIQCENTEELKCAKPFVQYVPLVNLKLLFIFFKKFKKTKKIKAISQFIHLQEVGIFILGAMSQEIKENPSIQQKELIEKSTKKAEEALDMKIFRKRVYISKT